MGTLAAFVPRPQWQPFCDAYLHELTRTSLHTQSSPGLARRSLQTHRNNVEPFSIVMASEELARKLQRRLDTEQGSAASAAAPTEEEVPAKCSEQPETPESERAATAGADDNNAAASSELNAKLTRRLDINDGIAAPKRSKVFNPYTEFKEFSRKQIKDMEAMFKR